MVHDRAAHHLLLLQKTIWNGTLRKGGLDLLYVSIAHGFRGKPKIVGQRLIVINALASSVNSIKLPNV
jgi:hypothetical protein